MGIIKKQTNHTMNTNSEQTETIAQEAYRLLKDVNTDTWITMFMSNGCGVGCALGHYNRLKSNHIDDFSEHNMVERYINRTNVKGAPSITLREKSIEFLCTKYPNMENIGKDIADINNDPYESYDEHTPKERVLHLLTDMIEAGY